MSSSLIGSGPQVIVALDFPDAAAALAFVSRLRSDQCRLKVGFELITAAGPALVERLVAQGFDVFLDLKFHDIPNTVASACAAATRLGVWMLNVHALGGRRMLTAAREALEKTPRRPVLIGVTVLTSHSRGDLEDIGLAVTPGEQVMRLAALVKDSRLDGVVASSAKATSPDTKTPAESAKGKVAAAKPVTGGNRPAEQKEKPGQLRLPQDPAAIRSGGARRGSAQTSKYSYHFARHLLSSGRGIPADAGGG